MTESSPEAAEIRITVVRRGDAPPCLAAGRFLCRSCPGWDYMLAALKRRQPAWNLIHCSATGLTIRLED